MDQYVKELEKVEVQLAEVEDELQDLLAKQSSLIERRAELQAYIDQNNDIEQQQKAQSWEGTDFPWSSDLDEKLKSVFKLSSLRPMQRQTMNATLSKEDTLLIMPTGGGKSLCFQLPALIDKGLTLVVSPLVSLMEDQLMALEQLGVAAALLNAASSKEDVKFVQDEMVNERAKLKLLYVTPEKLAKSKRFMNRLEKCYSLGRLARIVIDEVHCCSQWGHDFRPDYKFLGIMKRQFPATPILGLTATATTSVLDDVKKILNIPRAFLFKTSFNRPNLFYEVRQKPSSQKETMDEMYHLIQKRFHNLSGIIYCFSRKETEEVTVDLMSRGIKAGCYHADMDAKSRSRVHRSWLCGEIQVVVATVAFGMGIDKPDVRFVIHHSISKSMENLYQESGRAGRDDKWADCIVLYRFADVARQSSMVFTEQTGLQNLHGIVKYCIDMASCRRCVIASHFGEVWDRSHCNSMCDNCVLSSKKGAPSARDVTKYCQDVLTILDSAAATEQRVTSAKLVDAWYGRGPASLKVKDVSVPPLDKDTAERVLAHMLMKGFIQEDFHFTAYSTICYVVAGSRAKSLRCKTTKVFMDFRIKSVSASSNSETAKDAKSSSAHTTTASAELSTPKRHLSSASPENHKQSSSSASTGSGNETLSNACKSSASKSSSFPLAHQSEKDRKPMVNGKNTSAKDRKSIVNVKNTSLKDKKMSQDRKESSHSSPDATNNSKKQNYGNESKTKLKSKSSDKKFHSQVKVSEKHHDSCKRPLVLSLDSDEDDDFNFKRPRSENATDLSITISDGSGSESND